MGTSSQLRSFYFDSGLCQLTKNNNNKKRQKTKETNKEEEKQMWHLEKVKVNRSPHLFRDTYVSGSQAPTTSLSFEVCSWYLLHPREMLYQKDTSSPEVSLVSPYSLETQRAALFYEERFWLRSPRRSPELRAGFPCKLCLESKCTMAPAPNYVPTALGLWHSVPDAETQVSLHYGCGGHI